MKILVCLKVIKGEINPFDQSALECALTLSDDVTVVSMCPESAKSALLPLTRLGAKVVLLSDSAFAGSDTLATSYILSVAARLLGFDLILCGRQTIDGDTAQVGPMLSARLGISLVTNALKAELSNSKVIAKTREGEECVSLPALVTIERGYVLRFPSIFSKPGEVLVWDNSVLSCDTSKCGLSGSPTKVLEAKENERGKRKCKFISFDELTSLIEKLRAQESIVESEKYRGEKLERVWAVGKEVTKKAREIAKEVVELEKLSPEEITQRAVREKPEVILYNADLWGRKNAPIVAANLETGLCADCTRIEAENGKLIMHRPAGGGSIMAKIECKTLPQMATVRTESKGADILVSAGKGVADSLDRLYEFADAFGAQIGASRGLVDTGKVPYEYQVGLTGKNVSPKIYIAVGISGAVHHTCAIEGAGTVIAINPDKDARIFEYADFGILEEF